MGRERNGFPRHGWACSLLVCALAAGLLSGCVQAAAPVQAIQASPAGAGVEAASELKGRLEPRRFVTLGVSVPGRIESVAVEEGERVEAGEALFRLEGGEGLAAEVAAAEFERLQARRAMDDLYRTAGVAFAESTARLRRLEKERLLAEDRLESLQRPKEKQRLDQASANLLLAEKQLAQKNEDLRKARQKYANKNSLVWMFTNQRQFRLQLVLLEKGVAVAERRYWDASQKYADLLAPLDEIDLAIAQAEPAAAQAQVRMAELEREKLLAGPDPALVEAAQIRLRAAEASLAAAKSALSMAEITAPFSGVVVRVEAKAGEWAQPGQPLVVVADLSAWVVESSELGEDQAPGVQAGQPVSVRLDAYPELSLNGVVEWTSLYSEDDEGEVFYRTRIGLEEAPPGLRWGMTVRVRYSGSGIGD